MVSVRTDAPLEAGWNPVPVLWAVTTTAASRPMPDCTDTVLDRYLRPGDARTLLSFGHDEDGVHILLTRAGTPLHRDPAYARYSHQIILRNDGNRVRGLPAYDTEGDRHPPMVRGLMYALDTHSPHQGLPDPRMQNPRPGTPIVKAVIAVDRDDLLTPEQAWPLLARYLPLQLADIPQPDPRLTTAPGRRTAA